MSCVTALGTVLIFDEVVTGLRLSMAPSVPAGCNPILSIYAKALANGFPVAAIIDAAT